MKTEKKHNGSLWARVALMLALMMVYTLSASALDLEIPIDMTSATNSFTCEGGTITKSGSNLSVTPNEYWTIYIVQGVKSNTTYYEEIPCTVTPFSEYYDCRNYTSVKVTFRVESDNVVVTFDMNGYGGDAPIAQNLKSGQTVGEPTLPTQEGLEFDGWYTDAACTVPFDFTTPLGVNTPYSSFTGGDNPHLNLTLYAKWLAYQWGNCGKVDEQAGLDGSEVTWEGYKTMPSGIFEQITISGTGEIAPDAFLGNEQLKEVVINEGVTSIGQAAFSCCTGLTSVTIPASVTSIGEYAFLDCSGLTSVTIPASVTSIGEGAFFFCTGLTSVTIYAPSLKTYGPYAFDGNAKGRNIYVFSDCVDTYKAGWSGESFVDEIVSIPEGNLSVNTTVNANPQATDEYWSTYYHPTANVKINTNGVEIYKATLNNTKTAVTLTKVEGNVIKAGQAVMLKATTEDALSMELTPVLPTGDYSGNDLKGGSTVPTGYNAYTLAAEDNQLGFYNFNGDGLNASKAHLEIPEGATPSVRMIIGFDEATEIDVVDSGQWIVDSSSDAWYTLDGRKLDKLPTRQGIYIHGARTKFKVVIK